MATIEDLISVLLPLLPDAYLTIDESGEVVIHTDLTVPDDRPLTTRTATG